VRGTLNWDRFRITAMEAEAGARATLQALLNWTTTERVVGRPDYHRFREAK
jgi:hypothetical protein